MKKRRLQKKRHIIILLCVPDLFDRVKSKMKRHQFLINFMQKKTLSFRCIYDWLKCIKYSSKNSVKQSNGVESFFFQCTIKGEEKREKNASIFFSFVLRNILCLVRVLNDIQLVRHIFIHISKENSNRMHLHTFFYCCFHSY